MRADGLGTAGRERGDTQGYQAREPGGGRTRVSEAH